MALTDDSMVMPVSPYGGNGGFGNGNFGGDWGWIILLLLFAGGGWGNGFGGWGGGNELYPWMNQAEITQGGFQNLSTQNQITAVQSDLGDIQTQLCNGFAGVNAAICNGFSQAEIAENSRQMANMQQMFDLSTQFANCCCENRLANCQTQNIIQNEGNMTRFADANNTRDIITTINDGVQSVQDKLCQLELDAKNDKIGDLERQLTMANLSASQNLQTQTLLADNFAQTNALEQYLSPTPRPAYIVQNPNCCTNTCGNGCGCGM